MYDLVIIGSGPAGQTAALYASRAGLKVLMIEKGAPGGKVFMTHSVENYPGYKSIGGRDLANLMQDHALQFGAEHTYGDVISITEDKKVITNMGEYQAKAIIIATGTENIKLGVEGEDTFYGKGVSYCAICDGNFFKDKDVVVVGGGNSALEESAYLSAICNSVTIVHRREDFKAEKYISEKIQELENIKFELNSIATKFNGEDKLQSVSIKNLITGEEKDLSASGVFVYIGLYANVEQFKDIIKLDERGSIMVDENMQTNVDGIFAAGDCRRKPLRQIATAISDGAIAAQSVINFLQKS